MPELPEVEIARQNLVRWTVGREIVAVSLVDPDAVDAPPPWTVEDLVGRRLTSWDRRGKYLVMRLEPIAAREPLTGLVSHLGMTGKWVRTPPGRRFERLALTLDDGGRVALLDARRLGRTWLVTGDPAAHPRVAALGPDPLRDGLDGDTLRARLGRGRATLKAALLDQARVAGVGNICAVEGTFRARIHPHTRLDAVPPTAWSALAAGLLDHIAVTLETEAGDELAYVNEGGPNPFLVYGREGEACPRCGAPIRREVLGGRPSFVCPACQPLVIRGPA